MKLNKINLDAPEAAAELEAMRLIGGSKPFDCVVQLNMFPKEFTGYFSADSGEFFMTQQSKGGYFLKQSDARKLIEMVESKK